MKRYKISYTIDSLSPGGAETQLVKLVESLDKSRFEPVIYTFCSSDKNSLAHRLEKIGVVIKTLDIPSAEGKPFRFSYIIAVLKGLFKLLMCFITDRPKIYQGFLFLDYIFGAVFAKLTGVNVIITSRRSLYRRSLSGLDLFKSGKFRLLKGLDFEFLRTWSNLFTDLVICNSDAVLRDALENEKLKREKTICIYNGCDADQKFFSEEEKESYVSQWRTCEGQVLIGVVAQVNNHKGHEYLIRAIPHIKKLSDKDFRIIIVGRNTDYRGYLDKLIEELNVQEYVHFAGPIPWAERVFPLFDISVLPTLGEGFSNTVMESMISGLPVVTTDVGGNPEAVEDGITGFLVPPMNPEALGEKIALLLDDENLRKEMGRRGRERILNDFSVEKMVRKTEELYLKLLAKKGID